ncbi:chemotaxis-specific protein-glutamate methyltransferase CheB [Roseimaritima ulvae]|uniref:Protein-glutamate methylesterase/protein-glutamine glutaminase n=1 Tax=Roseimaritima ulvae TaxID=980254 RepID=A0A5B9R1A9_9BACT|nr:chemotaxis-specific protein-glutamate methyltransferase CheB [Roseimaritima ulvae]QEG39981.1 Chemotaxis response regulator protein-glutamate methylesterase [Roseimaritima ulvae]
MPRILIVDDSPTAREMLAAIMQTDPDIEVIGFAINGREAVAKTKDLQPDLVTMDVNMPELDGFQATKEIMIECPTPIIIVSSSPRIKEVSTSMQALQAGALTVLSKPSGVLQPDFHHQAAEIISNVKAMADVLVIRHRRRMAAAPSVVREAVAASPIEPPVAPPATALRCVAVVASTGGPPALAQLLRVLPADFPVPILLVQHIVSAFGEGFVRWLDSVVPLRVTMAVDGELLQPGCVYVAPHDHHLGVTKGCRTRLDDGPEIGGFRPAGDFLFASAAEMFGEKTVGIILTGMGQDGVQGIRAIRNAGGRTIAQDEQSCVIYGMPRAAVEQGLIDDVLPIDQIPGQLMRMLAACSS